MAKPPRDNATSRAVIDLPPLIYELAERLCVDMGEKGGPPTAEGAAIVDVLSRAYELGARFGVTEAAAAATERGININFVVE
jgi:hypothetical protein